MRACSSSRASCHPLMVTDPTLSVVFLATIFLLPSSLYRKGTAQINLSDAVENVLVLRTIGRLIQLTWYRIMHGILITSMARNAGKAEHPHEHGDHGHTHGAVDPSLTTSERGIWAVKWSFVGLFITALLQLVVVLLSGSVALLSDTIHNFGDAATAVPLWLAFALTRLGTSRRFPF